MITLFPLLATLLAPAVSQGNSRAETAYEASVRQLAEGDVRAAESSAREAITLSNRFVPEQEIEVAPEKGLLFEDMILEARGSYRSRRARYFEALGDALVAQERWRASRKAYRRAVSMSPKATLLMRMADQPDLTTDARLDLLEEAFVAPDAAVGDIERALRESGVFRTENALKAALDARRAPELEGTYPAVDIVVEAFPEMRAVTTDLGPISTAERFAAGSLLFLYRPMDGCERCSEELDALTRLVPDLSRRRIPTIFATFVDEADLETMRRIVRLLGIRFGVGLDANLPAALAFYHEGEIRIVARGGIVQFRLSMADRPSTSEIRRWVEAVIDFLGELPDEREAPLANRDLIVLEDGMASPRQVRRWIETLAKLESGPAGLDDHYAKLDRTLKRVLRDNDERELRFELLEALSRLERADTSKSRVLVQLASRIRDRLLEEAKRLDASVRRAAAAGDGVFFTHVDRGSSPARVYLQSSFRGGGPGFRHFAFVLEDTGDDLRIVWAEPEEHEARGIEAARRGGVFLFETADGCRGLRLAGETDRLYEGCPALLLEGEIVEPRSALVDPLEAGPQFFRRGEPGSDGIVAEETALERGLRLFEEGQYATAITAFEEAAGELDPLAPYDESALRYNRARSLEQMGKRQEALALYRSLGDPPFQALVDERAGIIEGAPRDQQ